MLHGKVHLEIGSVSAPLAAKTSVGTVMTTSGFLKRTEPEMHTFRLRQNGRHFSDNIFKGIFLNGNCCILKKKSLKCVLQGPINIIPALVQWSIWFNRSNGGLLGLNDLNHLSRDQNDADPTCDNFNSLWPSDAIERHRSRSALDQIIAQIIACCRTTLSHYWPKVDLSLVRSNDIHLKTIWQEISQPPITKISLKIIDHKFHSNLPGTNELRAFSWRNRLHFYVFPIKWCWQCTINHRQLWLR